MSENQFEPRVFTRDDPCTKIELWNCLTKAGRPRTRTVVEARTEIGVNAPKYLWSKGYIELTTDKGVDNMRLTRDGEAWLREGLTRYLELHPERRSECDSPPTANPAKQAAKAARAARRTAPARPQTAGKAPAKGGYLRRTRRAPPDA